MFQSTFLSVVKFLKELKNNSSFDRFSVIRSVASAKIYLEDATRVFQGNFFGEKVLLEQVIEAESDVRSPCTTYSAYYTDGRY